MTYFDTADDINMLTFHVKYLTADGINMRIVRMKDSNLFYSKQTAILDQLLRIVWIKVTQIKRMDL